CPGKICHRHSVARCDRRIGGVLKELARPAGAKYNGLGIDLSRCAEYRIEVADAYASPVLCKQALCSGEGKKGDAAFDGCAGDEGTHDLFSGRVAVSVKDATPGVRCLLGENKVPSLTVEIGPPSDQFLDITRPFVDQYLDG